MSRLLLPAYTQTPRREVLVGDAVERLRWLPGGTIDTVVTSPPYFRLRNYGVGGQIGLEGHVDAWVKELRRVMTEIARVLVPTGTVWLNVGDSYSMHTREGAPRKSLIAAPERLLLALMDDGWTVRNKVVWAKTNPIPSSVTDRLSCVYEVVYLLARSEKYYFDLDSIRMPHTSAASPRKVAETRGRPDWLGPNADGDQGLAKLHRLGLSGHPLGKNPGDVWRLSTSRYKGAHFATYPVQLVERMLRATCPERRCVHCRLAWQRPLRRLGAAATRLALRPMCGCHQSGAGPPDESSHEPGLVLDPFMGAGSTAIAALDQGKDWLGIELNPDYAALASTRIDDAITKKGGAYA